MPTRNLMTNTKRWITLREAAVYSSIGETRLVGLAKNGEIRGFQDASLKTKPWIFDIYSIDTYREAQCTQPIYAEKALAIMRGISL